MVMFEERPYRQKKKSIWSIWWFVGLMACGLTAWHLELIPFAHQFSANVSSQGASPGEQSKSIVKSTIDFSATPKEVDQPGRNHELIGQAEPTGFTGQPEPAFDASHVSHTAARNSSFIQQASYGQTVPQANAPQTESSQPFFNSKSEFTPVRTLTYRPETEPVIPRQIPSAGTSPPIHLATHQQRQDETAQRIPNPVSSQRAASPVQTMTAGYSTPAKPQQKIEELFQLSPEAEQDIVRHRQLSEIYWKQPENRSEIAGELERLAREIYFSPEKHYFPAHTVQPGGQLRLIARNYDVSWEYLSNLNRTKPERIRAGQKLKVIQGPLNAVVDLNDYRITIHAHGYYVCSFPIGTGKDGATPTGNYSVLNKEQNPTYYGSEKVISRNDPLNPLGEHWIDLGNGYGIHGTINPASIGQSLSKGCIRMNNADVAQVYDLLTTKSTVTIRQ